MMGMKMIRCQKKDKSKTYSSCLKDGEYNSPIKQNS